MKKYLPHTDESMEINAADIKSFRNNGHILIPGVMERDEVEFFRNAIVKAVSIYNTEKRKMEERDTYGKAFLQIMNLWRVDETVKEFVFSKRLAGIAAQLLGVEKVRLYHDQALFKEPGGGPTPWHQDQYYWPIDTSNTVTMWMPLIDINQEMGIMAFASGSHTKGSVLEYEISDKSEMEFDHYIKDKGYAVRSASAMHAGDTTWHYGFTIHNAPGNKSPVIREVMTIIYIADGAKVVTPKNVYQENDRRSWLQSAPVGAVIDSSLNPILG
jgi:ectoine hydroxylase-related dioxygenase (phytanoyl-CoA dioxygenase family)